MPVSVACTDYRPPHAYHYKHLLATDGCALHVWPLRRWNLVTMAEVQQSPIFNYAGVNIFLTKKQRKQWAKGKAVRGMRSTRREEETKVIVVSNGAEDCATSFDIGHVYDSGTLQTQPMRVAKLHGRIVADASNSQALI